MGFTLRRSLPSIGGLLALLLIVGVAAVIFAGAPVWFPAVFAIGMIGLQYAINPLIIQWLVPASIIDHDGSRYLTDHPVGELVARRCRDAGVPLVKLAYGRAQVHAEREAQAKALAHSGRRSSRIGESIRGRSMNVMGIFDQREAQAMAVAFASGIDPARAVAAMRWEVMNPWGKT